MEKKDEITYIKLKMIRQQTGWSGLTGGGDRERKRVGNSDERVLKI